MFKTRRTKKVWGILLAIVIMLPMLPATAFAVTSGDWIDDGSPTIWTVGDGGSESPFEIGTAAQLAYLAQQVNGGTKYADTYFKLTDNIDLADHYWTPIGNSTTNVFQGIFDGNNKTITGLYIGTSEVPNTTLGGAGLFGFIGSGASIRDLGVGVTIYTNKMSSRAGGLAGYLVGATVNNCYTTGTISGIGMITSVAGFIGSNNGSANIINSYSTVDVSYGSAWGARAGGFIGDNDGTTIANCYATGNVTGTGTSTNTVVGGFIGYSYKNISNCYAAGNTQGGADAYVGGFIGDMRGGTITNAYWNSNASQTADGVARDDGDKKGAGNGTDTTTALSSAQMAGATTTASALVDTLNTNKGDSNPTWYSWKQASDTNSGYPTLFLINVPTAAQPEGAGTKADPYQIASAANLVWMSENYADDAQAGFAGKYFRQTTTIDMTGASGWVPIGDNTYQFEGMYDGNQQKITNLTLTDTSDIINGYIYFGLFGYVGEAGVIKNLTLEDARVSSAGRNYSRLGILAGLNSGAIRSCFITETAEGRSSLTAEHFAYMGPLAGANDGMIYRCRNEADVTANISNCIVGGIVGDNYGEVRNCSNQGVISSPDDGCGGITGMEEYGYTLYCLNTGSITATGGGIIGILEMGQPAGNFYLDTSNANGIDEDRTGSSSGSDNGCTQESTANLKLRATFTNWDFDYNWSIDNGNAYPCPMLPSVEAQELSVTATPGSAAGTTKITLNEALSGADHYLFLYNCSNVSYLSTPYKGDPGREEFRPLVINPYTAGDNDLVYDEEDGIDFGYVGVYEVNEYGDIEKFKTLTLAPEDIAGAGAGDNTAPTLTSGSATRNSDSAATVKLSTDEAGAYYYKVVGDGDPAPTIDTTDAGTYDGTAATAAGGSETTVALGSLTAGAKKIYIVVKDSAGNVSDVLAITIAGYSSGGGNNDGDSPAPAPATREVPVLPTDDKGQAAPPIPVTIERTTVNGRVTDNVEFTAEKAQETVSTALENGKNIAVIAINDSQSQTAQQVAVQIPQPALRQLADNKIDLSIVTAKAQIELPAETMQAIGGQDIDFTVREETDADKIKETGGVMLQMASGSQMLFSPIVVDSNITSRVKITVPIDQTKLPQTQEELDNLLDSLAILVQHSDGENVIDKGQIEYGPDGKPAGISIWVDKFSTFTVIGFPNVQRLSGADRFATATAISQEGWPDGADTIILANADKFADALAGVTLAGMEDSPILLTNAGTLNSETRQELVRLQAVNIYILGGEGAVSPKIEESLKAQGYQVTRIGAADRFATAVGVGETIIQAKPADTVILAYGYNFADALSVSTFAVQNNLPLLFTDTGILNPDTRQALLDWKIKNVVLVGGGGVIGSAVEEELKGLQLTVTRLGGQDRYDTAMQIIRHFSGKDLKNLTLTTGKDFPDALSGAVFAAKKNAPVMLFDPKDMSDAAQEFVKGYLQEDPLYILGGKGAVTDEALYMK